MNPQTETPALPSAQPAPQAAPATPEPRTQMSFNSVRTRAAFGYYDGIMDLVFRFGFATVFLANSWTAIVDPSSFLKLIEGNFMARMVGHFQLQLYIIMINDFLLGALIIFGVRRKLVYAWAGAWLLIVTFFKITSLV